MVLRFFFDWVAAGLGVLAPVELEGDGFLTLGLSVESEAGKTDVGSVMPVGVVPCTCFVDLAGVEDETFAGAGIVVRSVTSTPGVSSSVRPTYHQREQRENKSYQMKGVR